MKLKYIIIAISAALATSATAGQYSSETSKGPKQRATDTTPTATTRSFEEHPARQYSSALMNAPKERLHLQSAKQEFTPLEQEQAEAEGTQTDTQMQAPKSDRASRQHSAAVSGPKK